MGDRQSISTIKINLVLKRIQIVCERVGGSRDFCKPRLNFFSRSFVQRRQRRGRYCILKNLGKPGSLSSLTRNHGHVCAVRDQPDTDLEG
jgi:hypothetical protein